MALVCSVAQKRAGRSKCGFCLLLAFKYVCSHSPPWPLASTPLSVDLFNYLSPIHFPSRLPISISNWNSYSVSPGSTHIHTHTHTLSYIDLHFFCSATHCLASHCPSLCWPMLPAGILFRSNCHPIELSLSIYRVAAVRISVALWLDVKFPKFSNFIACFSSCISFYCNWLGFVLCCFCFTPLSFSI